MSAHIGSPGGPNKEESNTIFPTFHNVKINMSFTLVLRIKSPRTLGSFLVTYFLPQVIITLQSFTCSLSP